MKTLLLLTLALGGCSTPSWYQAESSPGQRADLGWGLDVFILDPLTTAAADVDDLHRERKRAVCEVGATDPDALLQLCRDKGFDAVTFALETVPDQLLKRAGELDLPVLTAPAGSAGRRTTSGS